MTAYPERTRYVGPQPTSAWYERVIMGPAPCMGCGQDVVLIADLRGVIGWLHAGGHIGCRRAYVRREVEDVAIAARRLGG